MPVLLAEQVRDSLPMTDVGHVNAGAPRNFDFEVICTDWLVGAGSLHFTIERSRDDGVTWEGFGNTTITKGNLGKGATQAEQILHAKRFGVSWDGAAMDVRIGNPTTSGVEVLPAPFAWGLKTFP